MHIQSFYYTNNERASLIKAAESGGHQLIHDNHHYNNERNGAKEFSHGELIFEDHPAPQNTTPKPDLSSIIDNISDIDGVKSLIKQLWGV
tara:strand:- start:143 stop:412 length:270 start_codon:yes stop_codon:yes gene_type:complete